MSDVLMIPLGQLRPRNDARAVDFQTVDALASSFASVGRVLNPIVVREKGEGLFEIVAGVHRFMACDKLEWEEAPCRLETLDDVRAELAMIDENLCRSELSPAQRADQISRRQSLYERMAPETKAGAVRAAAANVAMGRQDVGANPAPTFTTATAAATGRSERSVQLDAQRGREIEPEALSAVTGTRLDRGSYLDELRRTPRAEQVEKVHTDLQKTPRSDGVSAQVASKPQRDPSEAFARFLSLADEIEALGVRDIIAAAGKQRSLLGQRANGLGSMMDDIGEGLTHA